MQDMNPSACSSQTTPAASATTVPTKTLTDSRDGNKYTISKLADGNCWMTQNLRIVDSLLTPADSNVQADYYLPPSTAIDKDKDDPKYFTSNDQYSSLVHYAGDSTNGTYYNWYTATAGTGDASITTKGQNTPSSICPKGWQLPTSNNTSSALKSFGGLTTAYNIGNNADGSTKLQSAPLNFVYGGNVVNSSLNNAGFFGRYWSSTAGSSANAYLLLFDSSYVSPSDAYNRYRGSSVRYVAR